MMRSSDGTSLSKYDEYLKIGKKGNPKHIHIKKDLVP